MRVLLVEDEERLSSALAMGLRAEGFVVVTAATGVDGLFEATANDFDVVAGHHAARPQWVRGVAADAGGADLDSGNHADGQGR